MEAAIFDVDGTLLDSMGVWEHLGERYLKALGKTPESGLQEILRPMTMEQSCQYLRKRYALDKTPEEIRRGLNGSLETFYREEVTEKPRLRELLTYLKQKGMVMAVATATDSYLVESALIRLGLRDYFQGIWTCAQAGAGKEDPAVYHLALDSLKKRRERCLVFEDAPYAVATAVRAGFPVVAVAEQAYAAEAEMAKEAALTYWDPETESVAALISPLVIQQ